MMEADVQVLKLPALSPQRPVTRWRSLWLFIKRKSLGAIGAGLLAIFGAMAILAPAQATHDPDLNDYRARVKPPSAQHWFGTDNFGRDMYSRVVYGVRISIYVGVLSPLLGTTLGAFAGPLSGFFGGHIDQLIQRLADAMFTIPPLVLAMAIVTMLSPSLINVVIAIAIPRLPNTNRVIRSAVLSTRESLYVEASSALGCLHWRIMLRHLLPNVTAPIMVVVTAGLGGAILVEASLSFWGLGVPPPAPS
jgi:peptide/nickel transport system permease protein